MKRKLKSMKAFGTVAVLILLLVSTVGVTGGHHLHSFTNPDTDLPFEHTR